MEWANMEFSPTDRFSLNMMEEKLQKIKKIQSSLLALGHLPPPATLSQPPVLPPPYSFLSDILTHLFAALGSVSSPRFVLRPLDGGRGDGASRFLFK